MVSALLNLFRTKRDCLQDLLKHLSENMDLSKGFLSGDMPEPTKLLPTHHFLGEKDYNHPPYTLHKLRVLEFRDHHQSLISYALGNVPSVNTKVHSNKPGFAMNVPLRHEVFKDSFLHHLASS